MSLSAAPTDGRRTAMAVTLMVSAAAPAFMVGALAAEINDDFTFGAAQLGLAMTLCYTVAGLCSPLGARVVVRLGNQASARVTCALACLGLVGLALAQDVVHVLAASIVFGMANALCQPASNQLLSHLEHPRRRAFAFGVVQASMPTGALLAGMSLTVTSRGVDWRAVIVAMAVVVASAQLVHVRVPDRLALDRARPTVTRPDRGLITLILAGTLASAAASALPIFVVTAGLSLGISAFAVAAAQIAGSVGSIVVRITAPLAVSQASTRHRFQLVTGLLCTGALGLVLLATGTPAGFAVGTVLGFTFGWGWNGLYNQLVASGSPERVAAATGLSQTGIFLGGTAGPAMVAVVATHGSFVVAWLMLAVMMLAAAGAAIAAAPRSASNSTRKVTA